MENLMSNGEYLFQLQKERDTVDRLRSELSALEELHERQNLIISALLHQINLLRHEKV